MNGSASSTEVSVEKVPAANCRKSYFRKEGLLCALVAAAALLATYPKAEMGIVDDWSYAKSALDFARTGHFIYNGWATAMLGWQIPWGALVIKLFGFSFTGLRLSMVPFAMASVYLLHQILIRFEVAPHLARFGAFTLGLSPLFVPLGISFMTDIPGLFVLLLCIYICQRAVAAGSDRGAFAWLCTAALLNVAGGTVRQIAWLGALVIVPSTAWLLRKRRGMIPAGIAMWLASLLGIFWFMHWFNQQPYATSEEALISTPGHPAVLFHLAVLFVRVFLCLSLIVLPLLVAWLPTTGKLGTRAWMRVVVTLLVVAGAYFVLGIHGKLEGKVVPWISHVIGSQGIIPWTSGYMLGPRPLTIGMGLRLVISLIVIAIVLMFAEQAFANRWLSDVFRRNWSPWREPAWLLGPFTLSYFVLLVPRGIQGIIFDRYLLPPMAVAIVVLLKLYQQEIAPRIPSISWVVLAVLALYTVAATHDWFALDRARVFAAREILASGMPRTEIQGGFEYDGWTQIEYGVYVNEPLILPKGTYNPQIPVSSLAPACHLPHSDWMPAVKPKYFVTFARMDCLSPSQFPAVGYRTWLPPFHRRIYIQQAPKISN